MRPGFVDAIRNFLQSEKRKRLLSNFTFLSLLQAANYIFPLITVPYLVREWLFQGMERMRYVVNLNVSSRLIFTVAIFVFVRERADYYIVPLLNSIAIVFIGVWSLALIHRDFGIGLKLQRIDTLKKHLEDGWHVFTSRIYLNLYTTTNTVLLGLLANNTLVGYYSAAEKLVMAIGGLFDPVNQAVYP